MIDGNFYSAVVSAAMDKVAAALVVALVLVVSVSFGAGYYFGQPKPRTKFWSWKVEHEKNCVLCQQKKDCPEFDRVFQKAHIEIWLDESDK
jgi:hypothetical protein